MRHDRRWILLCVAMLAAGCGGPIRPEVDAVDPEHYSPEPVPAPAREITAEQRLVVVILPPDETDAGGFDAPDPALRELKDRLHRAGRFRVFEAPTLEAARALAARHAGTPAFSDGPMILRWGVTNFRVVERDRSQDAGGLGFGSGRDLGMFKAEIKIHAQLTHPESEQLLLSAAGTFDRYVTGDWERGEYASNRYLLFRTRSSDTRQWRGNYGLLLEYAIQDLVRNLALEADAQYFRRMEGGGD